MTRNNTKILMFCAMAVVINVVLGSAVSAMKIPLLFLDTMGTIFIAANYGMLYGIMTGVATNLLMGLISGPLSVPFALVSVAVAIVVALVAQKNLTYKKAIVAGILLAFIAPAIGAPIRLALFGGFTGSGTDIVIMALRASGKEMISATYWGAVSGNLVDKIVSCLLVAWLIRVPRIKNVLGFN
ncbi:CD3073 family putative ECF transporter S component [Vagococcus acidifermentans]|uniref:ECF transporter S component n=1 Tax=Vagococcus acidifermentans TaxID=564710 RepID=A0A430B250_9ENTE|nr:CD3073 family putative ECF transporter S component [Vagococcus acidifermentans]RSU14413.1 ECF transporter S component [Vagococcus acidifermentans]